MSEARRWENMNQDFVTDSTPRCAGLEIAIIEEKLGCQSAWTAKAPYHSVLVHLAGQQTSHETKLTNGPPTTPTFVPGSVWIIPAGESLDTIPSGNLARFCEIRVPVKGPDLEPVEVCPQINIRDGLIYAAAQVFQRQAGKDVTCQMSTRRLIEAIQWHIIERYDVGPRRHAASSGKFTSSTEARIVSYLNDRIGSRITLEELAHVTVVDVHVLLRRFYASFGMTPGDYITRLRIERAKGLLASSSRPVNEISALVGFHDPSHFCASFMKNVGIAPMAFRQVHWPASGQRRRR